jgi:hypothetical protein
MKQLYLVCRYLDIITLADLALTCKGLNHFIRRFYLNYVSPIVLHAVQKTNSYFSRKGEKILRNDIRESSYNIIDFSRSDNIQFEINNEGFNKLTTKMIYCGRYVSWVSTFSNAPIFHLDLVKRCGSRELSHIMLWIPGMNITIKKPFASEYIQCTYKGLGMIKMPRTYYLPNNYIIEQQRHEGNISYTIFNCNDYKICVGKSMIR